MGCKIISAGIFPRRKTGGFCSSGRMQECVTLPGVRQILRSRKLGFLPRCPTLQNRSCINPSSTRLWTGRSHLSNHRHFRVLRQLLLRGSRKRSDRRGESNRWKSLLHMTVRTGAGAWFAALPNPRPFVFLAGSCSLSLALCRWWFVPYHDAAQRAGATPQHPPHFVRSRPEAGGANCQRPTLSHATTQGRQLW